MLSIYAEVNEKFQKMYSGDDDRNELVEILDTMSQDAQNLWRDEGLFVESLIANNWQRSDFDEFCEREIMKRFSKEEAALSLAKVS